MKFFRLLTVLFSMLLVAACAVPTTGLDAGIEDFKQEKYAASLVSLYPLAEQGNSDAQYAVGYILYYGKAGSGDRLEGIEWIKKSARQGNASAQRALGIIYSQINFAPEQTG